ncbi:MAG TPA: HAMP domain-containing sensor histidine kinase, partial [Gemmatimonadaceae bacterium]|nr:HAMP domain-containing sensor histidine kinase [Gemmatimonadaceae bacterium]
MRVLPSFAVDLSTWPGVVLRVEAGGDVVASNGRLEARLGVEVTGRPLSALLDADSSLAKWRRVAASADAPTCELVFASDARMLETSAYTVVREDDGWWLVEHPLTPRLAELANEVSSVNTELASTQRRLVIQQARLAHAMTELERSNLALDEFAHAVSHDLKAPLRAIREYAEGLVDAPQSLAPAEREADLRRIGELAARMRSMIDGALAYARAGRVADRVERVDTAAMLRELVTFLAPPADATIRLGDDLPVIETERVPLEQVFRNLLSNAITYRRESDARIEVTAHDAGDRWEIVVSDNGPGIPESQQPRIWQLFHTSRPGEGSGVGLALVKRIVESHGGEIGVRSVPGQGA